MKNNSQIKSRHSTPFWQRTGRKLMLGGAVAALAGGTTWAANIGPLGTGILGVNDAIDADPGTPHANAGTAANVNDDDVGTRVDTYRLGDAAGMSYVGVVWPAPRYESIETLTLTLATFFDGGWFGPNNETPGEGGALAAEHLTEPTVQVSTDGGVTWTTVAHTSDYMSVMEGYLIGDRSLLNPTQPIVNFTLNTPATEIDGIRIIGPNGGPADGNGFLGVFELAVEESGFTDSDGDGMPDAWETENGLVAGTDDAAGDPDGDGLSNVDEFTNSTNPNQADTDSDGLSDGDEVNAYTTNPLAADTDGDGLDDGAEVNTHASNPLLADSDGDGLADGLEVDTHDTDPNNPDSDNDGYFDGFEVAQGSDPTDPASIPNNLALQGFGLMGVRESLESEIEEEYYHAGTGTSINDGNRATRVDTFNGGTPTATYTAGFVGVLWGAPITTPVETLELTFATFVDGGWFGPNGIGPGAGQPLTAAHLLEPRVEVTTDGVTWTVVPHTSDYLDVMTGHRVGGGGQPNPSTVTATFTLDEAVDEIMGVRIAGTEGGQASGGFIGVFEFAALSSSTDVDEDGMDDAWERQNGLAVGTNDADEDPDEDGLTNVQEFDEGTDPQEADTDGDGLNDGAEVNQHNTNPTRADTDADGLSDGAEVNTHGSNPNSADTDADGFRDAIEVAEGTDPADATSFPANIIARGTAIIGTSQSIEAGPDTPHSNAGAPTAINDFNLTSRVDTFNGPGTDTISYVGVLWDEPITSTITALELTHAIFFDGGWFGVNGVGPGASSALSASEHLVEPTVQVTTDRGETWQTVEHTSDYLTALDGQPTPVAFTAPTTVTATFDLTEPQSNINGIRIIGTEGGTASGGFIGVFELTAQAEGGTGGGLRLEGAMVAAGQFRFEFDSVAGETHHVEYKNSLSDATWQSHSTITGDGTTKVVTDSTSGSDTRFYRVRTE